MNIFKKIKWALFENDDEPLREGYTPFTWWLRNPFHNLAHYVPPFGFKNNPNKKWLFPDRTLWRPGSIFNWNIGHCGLWPLFIVSINTKYFEFYIGHRPPQGVFGIALRKKD